MPTFHTTLDSPVGPLRLMSDGAALTRIDFARVTAKVALPADAVHAPDAPPFAEAAQQFAAYFAGELTDFDLPLAPHGTDFQLRVWEQLRTIRFGETWTYGQLAESLGQPTAARAVGLANGKNPLSIVVPCHRVIGADGSMTGFGGGTETKRILLELEGAGAPLFK